MNNTLTTTPLTRPPLPSLENWLDEGEGCELNRSNTRHGSQTGRGNSMYYQQASPSDLRPSHSLLPISHPSAILQLHKFHLLLHELNSLSWVATQQLLTIPNPLNTKKIASNVSEETPPSNTKHTLVVEEECIKQSPKTHCNSCVCFIYKKFGFISSRGRRNAFF
jgi:hypothetical protein